MNVSHRQEYQDQIKALEAQGLDAQLDLLWEHELSEKSAHNPQGTNRFDSKRVWMKDMIQEYAQVLQMPPEQLFTAMEKARNYWSANYYQEAKQPKLGTIRVFETQADVEAAIPKGTRFFCPCCEGLSSNPTKCDTGKITEANKPCDWAAYGLFGTMGKGFRCLVKERVLKGEFAVFEIFWPESIPKPEVKEPVPA